MDSANVLKLSLHGHTVGHLVGYRTGRNVLVFDEHYINNPERPTFTLSAHPRFENSSSILQTPWVRRHRLPPVLSNLLPEGLLRHFLMDALHIHINHEFKLLSWIGGDLPGALIAEPASLDAVPTIILNTIEPAIVEPILSQLVNKFSLAGVQMKFSMKAMDGCFTLPNASHVLGDWIIKTPSTQHPQLPNNEFTAMTLASTVSIEIPQIKQVPLEQLDNLPNINLPKEPWAFAIKRFDRTDNGECIKMEDFAQILHKYPHDKYQSSNYEQIGRILFQYSANPVADLRQMTKRLLVNILLANGDAHLKNWSVIYPDDINPRLSPAYDIVNTQAYKQDFALELGRNKQCYQTSLHHFQHWADKVGVSWPLIETALLQVITQARALWPSALGELPMSDPQKKALQTHWQQLQPEFRIRC